MLPAVKPPVFSHLALKSAFSGGLILAQAMVVSAITKKPTEKWWEGKKKGVMKGEKKKNPCYTTAVQTTPVMVHVSALGC